MNSEGRSGIKEPKDNTLKIIVAIIIVIMIGVAFIMRGGEETSPEQLLGPTPEQTISDVQKSGTESE